LQIIVHANLFELAAKTLLMNYFAKKGIDVDEWREHISRLTLGNTVKWLYRSSPELSKKIEVKGRREKRSSSS